MLTDLKNGKQALMRDHHQKRMGLQATRQIVLDGGSGVVLVIANPEKYDIHTPKYMT